VEKRADSRRNIKTQIICRRYRSGTGTEPIEGTIENCGPDGFCAELPRPLSRGTILVVQMSGDSIGCSAQDGVRSMGLAEVRWSKPISVKGADCYATGLKYLLAY
jgi:hypothetical protein